MAFTKAFIKFPWLFKSSLYRSTLVQGPSRVWKRSDRYLSKFENHINFFWCTQKGKLGNFDPINDVIFFWISPKFIHFENKVQILDYMNLGAFSVVGFIEHEHPYITSSNWKYFLHALEFDIYLDNLDYEIHKYYSKISKFRCTHRTKTTSCTVLECFILYLEDQMIQSLKLYLLYLKLKLRKLKWEN